MIEEIQTYYNIFKKVFEQKSLKKAIEYITFLKVEVNKFPKFLADYLNQNFFPELSKVLTFFLKKITLEN